MLFNRSSNSSNFNAYSEKKKKNTTFKKTTTDRKVAAITNMFKQLI